MALIENKFSGGEGNKIQLRQLYRFLLHVINENTEGLVSTSLFYFTDKVNPVVQVQNCSAL